MLRRWQAVRYLYILLVVRSVSGRNATSWIKHNNHTGLDISNCDIMCTDKYTSHCLTNLTDIRLDGHNLFDLPPAVVHQQVNLKTINTSREYVPGFLFFYQFFSRLVYQYNNLCDMNTIVQCQYRSLLEFAF